MNANLTLNSRQAHLLQEVLHSLDDLDIEDANDSNAVAKFLDELEVALTQAGNAMDNDESSSAVISISVTKAEPVEDEDDKEEEEETDAEEVASGTTDPQPE